MRAAELRALIALIDAFTKPEAQVGLLEIGKRLRQELKETDAREARRKPQSDDE